MYTSFQKERERYMQLSVVRRGFNYGQDGPGNRLVIHLQGCNLRCPWCSNPEGIAPRGTLMETGKPIPAHICPYGGILDGRLKRSVCDACVDRPCLSHPDRLGIAVSCARLPVETLLTECEQGRPLFFDGGGVTLTGGEPTLQFEAVEALLGGLRKRGIDTAMETNGLHALLPSLFPLLDLLIVDCKHPNPEKHREVTGRSNAVTLRNLDHAFANHPNLLVRTPLIHGFNDDDAALEGFRAFYRGKDTRRARFEFLRYHAFGAVKWQQCGMPYEMRDADVPEETRERFEQALRADGHTVVRT